MHQIQLVSPSPTNSITYFCFLARFKYFSISSVFNFAFSLCGPMGQLNPLDDKFFISYQLIQRLVFWSGLGNLFVSQSPREFYVSFSRTDSLFLHIRYDQILITVVWFGSMAHQSL